MVSPRAHIHRASFVRGKNERGPLVSFSDPLFGPFGDFHLVVDVLRCVVWWAVVPGTLHSISLAPETVEYMRHCATPTPPCEDSKESLHMHGNV